MMYGAIPSLVTIFAQNLCSFRVERVRLVAKNGTLFSQGFCTEKQHKCAHLVRIDRARMFLPISYHPSVETTPDPNNGLAKTSNPNFGLGQAQYLGPELRHTSVFRPSMIKQYWTT